jgi:surface protein
VEETKPTRKERDEASNTTTPFTTLTRLLQTMSKHNNLKNLLGMIKKAPPGGLKKDENDEKNQDNCRDVASDAAMAASMADAPRHGAFAVKNLLGMIKKAAPGGLKKDKNDEENQDNCRDVASDAAMAASMADAPCHGAFAVNWHFTAPERVPVAPERVSVAVAARIDDSSTPHIPAAVLVDKDIVDERDEAVRQRDELVWQLKEERDEAQRQRQQVIVVEAEDVPQKIEEEEPGTASSRDQYRKKYVVAGLFSMVILLPAVIITSVLLTPRDKETAQELQSSSPAPSPFSAIPPTALVQTVAPSISGRDPTSTCFETANQLQRTVDNFMLGYMYDLPISEWCVSGIQDFSNLFSIGRNDLAAEFNEDLSKWDVSKATNMASMFKGAVVFDQDLSAWKTSSVTNMQAMFWCASALDQDLSGWDVSSVTDMKKMFGKTDLFKQDLCSWGLKLPANTSCAGMFLNATACPTKDDPVLSPGTPGQFCHVCN